MKSCDEEMVKRKNVSFKARKKLYKKGPGKTKPEGKLLQNICLET